MNVHAQLWAGGLLIDQISPIELATLFYWALRFIRPENVDYSEKNQKLHLPLIKLYINGFIALFA